MHRLTVVFILSLLMPAPQSAVPFATTGTRVTTGDGPGQAMLADINGDDRLDLITRHLMQKRIGIQLGDGTGRFKETAGSPIVLATQPGDLKIADINSDRFQDILITRTEQDAVEIYFGDGKGAFKPAPNSPLAIGASRVPYTHSLDLIDLNEDGKLDIVTANHRQNTLGTLLGDGRGGFYKGPVISISAMPDRYSYSHGDLFADMDGDKHLDLVVILSDMDATEGANEPGRAIILYGDGKGAFHARTSSSFTVATAPHCERLADVNGDNRVDIVTSHGNSQINVLINAGDGKFTRGASVVMTSEPFGFVIADINRDQRTDLVTASGETFSVLLGAAQSFDRAGPPVSAGPGTYSVALGDINKDGRLDLVASSFEGNAVTIFLGR